MIITKTTGKGLGILTGSRRRQDRKSCGCPQLPPMRWSLSEQECTTTTGRHQCVVFFSSSNSYRKKKHIFNLSLQIFQALFLFPLLINILFRECPRSACNITTVSGPTLFLRHMGTAEHCTPRAETSIKISFQ